MTVELPGRNYELLRTNCLVILYLMNTRTSLQYCIYFIFIPNLYTRVEFVINKTALIRQQVSVGLGLHPYALRAVNGI